ncbi:MAG: hypothetical protein WBD63_07600 [Phycisphaerae bacterium]|nr:hypothetical protein [Phycisphaerae bacterium]
MNLFDKICAVPTIALGAVFMFLGALGLFIGCNAHFALPPILGCLPFFFGWAMCIGLIKYWRLAAKLKAEKRSNSPPSFPGAGYESAGLDGNALGRGGPVPPAGPESFCVRTASAR